MVSGLSGLGLPCDAECKAVLSVGLPIAQSAIELPPSLSNFEQLFDQGIAYVALSLAEQIVESSGIHLSDVVLENQAKEALTEMLRRDLMII